MNDEERKIFWDDFYNLDVEDINKGYSSILSTLPYPNELSRFRSVNKRTLAALEDNKLYFSSANHYDDPFDTYLKIDWKRIYKEIYSIKGRLNSLENTPIFNLFPKELIKKRIYEFNEDIMFIRVVQELNEKLRPKLQKKSFSICFSEDYLNQNLWLKYADNHKGFCLVYDLCCKDDHPYQKINILQNNNENIQNFLFPIYYSSDPYDTTDYALALLIDDQLPLFTFDKRIDILFTPLSKRMMHEQHKLSLIKHKCHKYDGEWRILPSSFAKNHQYSPITWKPSKVIIGLRTPDDQIKLIKRSAKIAGIKNIFKVFINEKDKLDIHKL